MVVPPRKTTGVLLPLMTEVTVQLHGSHLHQVLDGVINNEVDQVILHRRLITLLVEFELARCRIVQVVSFDCVL